MPKVEFKPGFRISLLDFAILASGAVMAAMFWRNSLELGFIVAFVVGHFFLFCNVFRISRLSELLWAGLFVGLTAGNLITGVPGLTITAAISGLATLLAVGWEMSKPSYHGILWKMINPGLPQWWDQRHGKATSQRAD